MYIGICGCPQKPPTKIRYIYFLVGEEVIFNYYNSQERKRYLYTYK